MKQLFIALIVSMFALSVSGQTADSSAQAAPQEAPANMTPTQKKAWDAKQKRDADAAKRKEEADKRKAESLEKRQMMTNQHKADAETRKASTGGARKSSGGAGGNNTSGNGLKIEIVNKDEDSAKNAKTTKKSSKKEPAPKLTPEEMRQAAAEKRKADAEQRKADAEKRKEALNAKRTGAPAKTTTTTDSTTTTVVTETKKGGKKAPEPKQTPEEARKEAAEKRQQAADSRKAEAEKRKQDAIDKKAADDQLKAAGVGTTTKKTPGAGGPAKKTGDDKPKTTVARPTHGPHGKGGKDDVAPAPVVVESQIAKLYQTLPLEALPQVKKYIDDHEDIKTEIATDSGRMHDTRAGLIAKEDAQRGYLQIGQLQTGKYTRIQMYTTKENRALLVIENNICTPDCINELKFYVQGMGGWEDVTDKYVPVVDKKYMLGKIKSNYKKKYMDNDVYNAKGYETDEAFYKSAIVYNISADANKIIVRDQLIDLPLYEITWDAVKGKFVAVKI